MFNSSRKVQEELVDGDEGLDEHLDSEEGWNTWREGNIDYNSELLSLDCVHLCKLR